MRKSELTPYEAQQFYGTYLDALGDVELQSTLVAGKEGFTRFVGALSQKELLRSYGVDKWTVAEVLGHVIDTERVFQYRALRFSRNDATPLPGFEQDGYVAASNSTSRSTESFIEEYRAVRQSTIVLFSSFNEEQLMRTGVASNIRWSVAGLGFVISGHQEHHKKILVERYFNR